MDKAEFPRVLPAPSRRKVVHGAAAALALSSLTIEFSRAASEARTYILIDPATDQVLDALQPDRPLPAASITKLVTTSLARAYLGGDHRFATELIRTDDQLWLSGGNPCLDLDELTALAAAYAELPGETVRALAIDDRGWPRLSAITDSQATGAPYNPGVAALALNFNRVRLIAKADTLQAVWEGATPAPAPNIVLTRKGLSADPQWTGRRDQTELWRLSPDAPVPAELPVKQPLLAIGALARSLGLGGPAARMHIGMPGRKGRVILARESPPLDRIVQDCLRYSNNLIAEMLALHTAEAILGRPPPSLAAAGAALATALRMRHPTIDWRGAVVDTGSGLGPAGRLTVRQIVSLMQGNGALAALMRPIAQAIVPRFMSSPGTLAYVRGLAGHFKTASGSARLFAILSADEGARAALDRAVPHALEVPPQSRLWLAEARRRERALLAGWGVSDAALDAL